MNEHPLDDMLAARCAAASPSASFEASIARALEPIEHAPGSRTATAHTPRPNRRNANARSVARPRWQQACRAAAAVAAIALCVGGTAYAAEKLGLSLWQTDKYQVQVEPPVDENAGPATGDGQDQLIDEYRLTFSYIPERLSRHTMDVATGSFDEPGYAGWSQFAPSIQYYTYYVDTDQAAPFSSIDDSEIIEIGDHEAALLTFDYGMRNSKRQTQTCLYVAFPEERRIVKIQTSDDDLSEELLKVARGMTFEPTGQTVPADSMFTWSDAISSSEYDANRVAERATASSVDPLCVFEGRGLTDGQMGDFLATGQTFPLPYNDTMSAVVTSVQLHDTAEIVNRDEMPFGWRELIDEDGAIADNPLTFVKYGDGQSTTDTVLRQIQSPLKLVEVTMTLTNTGADTQDNIYCPLSLETAVHEQGAWSQYRRVEECPEADEAQNALHVGTGWPGYVELVEAGTVGSVDAELGPFAPGEMKTVRFLWLVNADECDKLLLDIDPDGMNGDDEGNYADGTWGSRFIDIRQPQ